MNLSNIYRRGAGMTQAEALFLNLLKSGMLNVHSEAVSEELNSIEFLAVTHVCVPIVYQGALNSGVLPQESWKNSSLRTILRNENNLRVQKHVLDSLEAAQIPCAVIKGSSAAANYALPYIRPLGDIDILVRECDYEKTMNAFSSEISGNEEQNHKFHYHFTVNGFRVEIHKNICAFENDTYGSMCTRFFEHALDEVEYAEYENFCFPVLQKKYQALCLLFHMQRHFFENKLVMRMLCDWAMLVSSISKEEWERDVKEAIEKLELKKFSDALTRLCDMYLGTNNSDKIDEHFEPEIYEYFMEEFLHGGVISDGGIQTSRNFGNLYSQKLLKTKHTLSALLGTLNEIARDNFKIAKCRCFLPIFWFYLPIRYLFRQLIGKRDRLSCKNALNSAEHWKKLYKKFELRNF